MVVIVTLLAFVTCGIAEEAKAKRCVVVWSEGTAPKNIFPNDINGAVVEGLKEKLKDWEVVKADLSAPDQGLPDKLLNRADVLIWWGHKKHGNVKNELADKIGKRVKDEGMGFMSLHSAHFAKPNIKLMELAKGGDRKMPNPKKKIASFGAYKKDTKTMVLKVLDENHPITKGIPKEFSFANDERYDDPYNVPTADAVIFDGEFTLKNGKKTSSKQGFCWKIGKGRFFYFQPGHETNPIFFDKNIRTIMANAVLWAAPEK